MPLRAQEDEQSDIFQDKGKGETLQRTRSSFAVRLDDRQLVQREK